MGLEDNPDKNGIMNHIGDKYRIQILEEEIDYYKTLIEPHDCGHVHTTISFLESRIENLLGGEKVWPFK
mgnify:CR=1 FL=1